MFAPVTHTHTQEWSHQSGMLVLFTYCSETYLIEANLYGLGKQDFASFCIRCASHQIAIWYIRYHMNTYLASSTHVFSDCLLCFIWPHFHSPVRIFLTFFYFHIGMSLIIELSFKCLRFLWQLAGKQFLNCHLPSFWLKGIRKTSVENKKQKTKQNWVWN